MRLTVNILYFFSQSKTLKLIGRMSFFCRYYKRFVALDSFLPIGWDYGFKEKKNFFCGPFVFQVLKVTNMIVGNSIKKMIAW